MKTDTRKVQLLDQQLALSAYLDALLREVAPVQADVRPGRGPVPEAPIATSAAGGQVAEAVAAQVSESGVPDWAQTRFQALLFEVAGLTLAVPLVKLKGVVPNERGLTPMPGHSALFLGLAPYQGLQSKVVDTARFVLPEAQAARLSDDEGERAAHLVMIDEGRWALACNRIGEVIDLDHADVKWRAANGKRVWLAGMLIEKMCALLDVDELTRLLAEGMA